MLLLQAATFARTGLLHPQASESREVASLDGLWRFRADFRFAHYLIEQSKCLRLLITVEFCLLCRNAGLREQWQISGVPGTVAMAVPSSYNDLTQDTMLREHVGIVWYERETFVPSGWSSKRVVLYVGSANHRAVVWLNGRRVGEHEGGHLPFHLQLDPSIIGFGRSNRLTIALNNTLTMTTIPPGFVQTNAAGRRIQRLQMDFFHYAGLHRQVMLCTLLAAPLTHSLFSAPRSPLPSRSQTRRRCNTSTTSSSPAASRCRHQAPRLLHASPARLLCMHPPL